MSAFDSAGGAGNPTQEAGSGADSAPAGEVRLFLDIENDNVLSSIDENGEIFILDEFISVTQTTLANLETNFPSADYSKRFAVINGTTSANGGYQSDGLAWIKQWDEPGDPADLPSFAGGISYLGTNELIVSEDAGVSYFVDTADTITSSGLSPDNSFDGSDTSVPDAPGTMGSVTAIHARIWDSTSRALGQFRLHTRFGAVGSLKVIAYHIKPTTQAMVVDSANYDILELDSIVVNSGCAVLSGTTIIDYTGGFGGEVSDVTADTLNTTIYFGYGVLVTYITATPGTALFREMLGFETVDATALVTTNKDVKKNHAGHKKINPTALTANTLLTEEDYEVLVDSSAGVWTEVLPAVSTVDIGKAYLFKKVGTGTNAVTLDGAGAEEIDGSTTNNTALVNENDAIEIISDGTQWLITATADQTGDKIKTAYEGEASNPIATTTGLATVVGDFKVTKRIYAAKGADSASADEMALGDGNYFDVTGTTTINHITNTAWVAGSVVTLQFDASVTVTHNAATPAGTEASILLAGAVDFSATADDTLTLVYDGITFRETSRSVI